MKNIIDYSKTNLYTFSEKRFNNVDSLILSQLSYINFDNLVGSITANKSPITFKDLLNPKYFNKMFNTIPYSKETKELLFYISSNPRFRNIKINYYISKSDVAFEKQFSATTFILNENLAYIAFRGTDYSLIGWKEDFNMSFITPVPSQLEGIDYINKVSKLISCEFYIGGHSKGGNIAIYASMYCNPEASSKIKKIFSHDSPGFKEEIIKSYEFKFIKNKIIKTIPGSSLIGMMFENNENYYIVKSNKLGGLQQHNPFSWQVSNFDFIYLKEISSNSKYTCKALNTWIKKIDNKKRKLFVESLFNAISCTNCKNFIELFHNWNKNFPIILKSLNNLDKEIKTMIILLFKDLLNLYIKIITHNE